MIAKPAKTLIISFNNNTPLVVLLLLLNLYNCMVSILYYCYCAI